MRGGDRGCGERGGLKLVDICKWAAVWQGGESVNVENILRRRRFCFSIKGRPFARFNLSGQVDLEFHYAT